MPDPLSYPGTYVEELPRSGSAIAGVATSITAFVGRTWRGPVARPLAIASFADYEREFGGLWEHCSLGHAVRQYFENGGTRALVVRTISSESEASDASAAATLLLSPDTLLVAANPGTWGRNLRATVEHASSHPGDPGRFNLTLFDDPASRADGAGRGGSGLHETFDDVSLDSAHPRFISRILRDHSRLARVESLGLQRPAIQSGTAPDPASGSDGVLNGTLVGTAARAGEEVLGNPAARTGLHALRKADLFNLLCIPPLVYGRATGANEARRTEVDIPMSVWMAAASLCSERRALLLIDAPRDWTVHDASLHVGAFDTIRRSNAALYFPRLAMADPLRSGEATEFAPCAAVAGVIARTDANRGVWKAPAGAGADLLGVQGLAINGVPASLADADSSQLGRLGINCLRALPGVGHVVWGARTLEGSDASGSQWKYLPVRRLALFLEESLQRGTRWVVFEPNDEALWAQVRRTVGTFLHALFAAGAFQGASPRDAYFVNCGRGTTSQADIDAGIVNIEVGFAALKPAEFVVVRIQQSALPASQWAAGRGPGAELAEHPSAHARSDADQ